MENFLKGKRVLFMGDSITALYMGDRGWPKYFCEHLEPAFHASTAVSGATWRDKENTVYDGAPKYNPDNNDNNVMGNQIEKLKVQKAAGNPDYAHFDAVLIAAGTNDGMPESNDICDAQFYKDGAYVPLEKADRHTWGGAIRYAVESLYELYPDIHIFLCTPIQADDKVRGFRSIQTKGNAIKDIAARLSVKYIDTLYSGVYGRYEFWDNCRSSGGRDLADGLHPNKSGAQKMGFFNAMAVKAYLG